MASDRIFRIKSFFHDSTYIPRTSSRLKRCLEPELIEIRVLGAVVLPVLCWILILNNMEYIWKSKRADDDDALKESLSSTAGMNGSMVV